jgi:hypothetical protein
MKRQRTMRPLAALAAVAGAVGLAAAGPLAGTAAAQGNEDGNHHRQIGYICEYVYEDTLNETGAVEGDECEPVNGAPFFNGIDHRFFIADEEYEQLYKCEYGRAEVTDVVLGFQCEELDIVV